jgi:serine/threonine protein kinase, bacterial
VSDDDGEMIARSLGGEVFTTFDAQDSGNVSYGVRSGERRYFVKMAGRVNAPELAARVARLRNAVVLATSCTHHALSVLDHVVESQAGPLLVYEWFEGELLGVPAARRDDPASSFARFRALPAPAIAAALTTIYDLHAALARAGWVAVDFYDGCLMYDFASQQLRVIDLDMYSRGPFTNTMGRMFGSTRFMAPEEFELGARIDERTTVFNLGRAAFVLLGERGSATQLAAATRACDPDPASRFATVEDFLAGWSAR